MAVLVFAKHDNTTLNDATSKTVKAAIGVGSEITVLVAGENCADVAAQAAKLEGVSKVFLAEDSTYMDANNGFLQVTVPQWIWPDIRSETEEKWKETFSYFY